MSLSPKIVSINSNSTEFCFNEYNAYDIPVEGKIKVIKYASDGTSLLQGVSFILKDSKGNKAAEGCSPGEGSD